MQSHVEFAVGIFLGLAKSLVSDVDVFLLGIVGLLLGSPTRRLSGIGKALLVYVGFRRADQYMGAYLSRQLRNNGS